MSTLPPPCNEDPRRTPQETDALGPTLEGDQNLLSGASLGAPPLEAIMSRFAPAELAIKGISFQDACRVIAETLLPDEECDLSPEQLRAFLDLTRQGHPLDRTELGELAPESGDLIIRQLLTLGSDQRRLTEETSLEFAVADLNGPTCSVEVSPSDRSDLCDITLDWGLALDYQSDYSLSERWDLVQQILLVAGEIDAATCKTRPLDSDIKRFQLEDRATIAVVARDARSANPAEDPHLSQRPDLIPLCALRLIDDEDIDPMVDTAERFVRLHTELKKVSPSLGDRLDLEDAMVSRSQLEQLGEAPFLWNSTTEMVIIAVERFLLVVTKSSTGDTLLEDIKALERYAAERRHNGTPPTLEALKSIQASEASEDGLAPVFAALAVPNQSYFVGALRDFVATENPSVRDRVRDGLLDSVIAGDSVTVELSRNYYIGGRDLEADVDENEDEDDEPMEAPQNGAAETAADEGEDPAWEVSEARVGVTRGALVVPANGRTPSSNPVVGFLPTTDSEMPGVFSSESGVFFFMAASVDENGTPGLPPELAAKTLRSLGIDPANLSVIASIPDPTSGEREGYLSRSVRVVY